MERLEMIGVLKTGGSLVGSAAAVAVLLGFVVKLLQPRAGRVGASQAAGFSAAGSRFSHARNAPQVKPRRADGTARAKCVGVLRQAQGKLRSLPA